MKAAPCRRSHGRPCASTSSAEPEARESMRSWTASSPGTQRHWSASGRELPRARGPAAHRSAHPRRGRGPRHGAVGLSSRPPPALGHEAYPTVLDRAAALLHSLARNHALVDSDKRLVLAALLAFLGLNDVRLTLDNAGAYDLVMAVASGELDDVPGIAARLGVVAEPWTVDGREIDGTASAERPVAATGSSRTPAAGRAASGRARGGPGCRRRRTSGATGRRWR